MAKIGMIGAGSWGTALTWLLTNNGHHVTMWSALEPEIEMLKRDHEQKDKLPGVILSPDTVFTTQLSEAVEGMDLLVLAVPSPFTRSTSKQLKGLVHDGQIIVNVAKGIEEETLLTLSQIIEEEIPQAEVAVLSGPSHDRQLIVFLRAPGEGAGRAFGDADAASDAFFHIDNTVFCIGRACRTDIEAKTILGTQS